MICLHRESSSFQVPQVPSETTNAHGVKTRARISPQVKPRVNQRNGPFSRPGRPYARKSVPLIPNNTLAMTKLSLSVGGRTICASITYLARGWYTHIGSSRLPVTRAAKLCNKLRASASQAVQQMDKCPPEAISDAKWHCSTKLVLLRSPGLERGPPGSAPGASIAPIDSVDGCQSSPGR